MTLENKLGITDLAKLAREEERISKTKALKLFETSLLDSLEAGKFASLAKIHEIFFSEIYEFTGKIRTINIEKENFRFAPVTYLNASLEYIDEMP